MVAWQRGHGRHDLPWQNTQDPYRVWLSEIMLQQTQVATVRGYYARFIERFPDVLSLAGAPLDEVLGLWSGLGYYSRARNLHRCAQSIVEQYGGVFPKSAQLLETLPGIGRSTAAAVAALCFGEQVAIMDANAKRVLARVLGFDADLARAGNVQTLWRMAADLLPQGAYAAQAMPVYTQGMMDLGAMVCLPKNPDCSSCPVRSLCSAAASGDPQRYPMRTRVRKRSSQSLWLLWMQSARGAVLLTQRPTPGVWAGLHCFPLFDSEAALMRALPTHWHGRLQRQPAFKHVLTHKDLHLHPLHVTLPDADDALYREEGRWLAAHEWPQLGLPAPVRKLLQQGASLQSCG
ncbi:MAG: A/G-specific adenine glycosylase [Rhodoferax sp.]|nr:A/G-specific adenine glycosylase [Rhodoferax sp.]